MDGRLGFGRRAAWGLFLIILVAGACSAAATTVPGISDLAVGATASPPAVSGPGNTPESGSLSPQASASGSSGATTQPATPSPLNTTPAPTAKPTAPPTPKPTKSPPPAPSLVIRTEMTSLGAVLAGSDQLTFYVSSGDGTNHSNCTGSCLANWPAVLVKAGTKVSGGPGVHGQFATFKRADGTTQVSYRGHPLYTFPGDAYPGDTTGQGLGGFSVAKP